MAEKMTLFGDSSTERETPSRGRYTQEESRIIDVLVDFGCDRAQVESVFDSSAPIVAPISKVTAYTVAERVAFPAEEPNGRFDPPRNTTVQTMDSRKKRVCDLFVMFGCDQDEVDRKLGSIATLETRDVSIELASILFSESFKTVKWGYNTETGGERRSFSDWVHSIKDSIDAGQKISLAEQVVLKMAIYNLFEACGVDRIKAEEKVRGLVVTAKTFEIWGAVMDTLSSDDAVVGWGSVGSPLTRSESVHVKAFLYEWAEYQGYDLDKVRNKLKSATLHNDVLQLFELVESLTP